MRKIFKIASYDFKRLIVNPFTIGTMILVLLVCLITGLVYKIEPTPVYSATTIGSTTREVYNNFMSTNENCDNKLSLDNILSDAQKMLDIQQHGESIEVPNARTWREYNGDARHWKLLANGVA